MSSHTYIAAFCFLLVASSWEPAAATAAAGSRRLQQIIVPRVAGGETAAKDRFPYMCHLTDQNHKHVCGGVLIAPKAVLTAAHCVDPSVDGAANQNLLVSVGAHDISQASLGASDALVTKVVDIKIHPEFEIDELRKGNDIAILILRDASLAQSVPLPLKGFSPNQTLLTLGWGQGSPVLQQLKLEPMTNAACADYYPGIGDNIQCARSLTGDACKGDSGGPLLIADSPDWRISKGDPRFDTLIALTSFGVEPCSDDGYPGAYTLVGPFRDWIDTELQSVKKSDQQVTTSITNGDTEDDEQGRSPLWIASTGGLVDRAKILIKNGAHLDEAEKDGSTPLTQASAYQHLEIVKLLIAAGVVSVVH